MALSVPQKSFTYELVRSVNCTVHKSIPIFAPLDSIIDTPEFQRLRNLKQLGPAYLVFPTANHTRFEHSLGVYAFAVKFMSQLHKLKPSLVDGSDVLCVAIAGLIHDIGHGAYSHTFDGGFMNRVKPNNNWKHEEGSIEMFKHMLSNNPEVKATLDQYLTVNDYTFIYELINPPKPLQVNGEWKVVGRPKSKSFLFDLISNPHDNLDVDKLDYFLRDSKNSLVTIAFSMLAVDRFADNINIVHDPEYGYNRIGYASKVVDDYRTTVQCRIDLHNKLYKHKTVVAIEEQLIDILALADPYLTFIGSDNIGYTMSESIKDMTAYSQVDDSVLNLIALSRDPLMKPAQNLLRDLRCRRLYQCLATLRFDKYEDSKSAIAKIDHFLVKEGIDKSKYFINSSLLHQGLGLKDDPIRHILVFDPKTPELPAQRLSKRVISGEMSKGFVKIQVYLKSYEPNPDLKRSFGSFIKENFDKEFTLTSPLSKGQALKRKAED